MRPLWHRTIEIAREPEWYRHCGVADTLEGRFDMVTAALAVVMLRMEGNPELAPRTAYLTEIFVEDMDGQLRQSGVGDNGPTLEEAARRNVTLTDDALARQFADRLRALRLRLDATSADAMLAGDIA